MTDIDTVAKLEGVIGRVSPAIALKVIDHLDPAARHWIAQSPLMFAGFADGPAIAITLAGGDAGFVGTDRATLRLPLDLLDRPALAVPGRGFGGLFLAVGIGETLRVNGRVTAVSDGVATIAVDECYIHCAKALIRSHFWAASGGGHAGDGPVAADRFLALATTDGKGAVDLSPKGDPAGRMAQRDGDDLWFADRPGNRRTDSFRNILTEPHVAGVLLDPGRMQVTIFDGVATLTTDEGARARFVVQDKAPLLAVRVAGATIERYESPALTRARLWPMLAAAPIDSAKTLVAHMKANRDRGIGAAVLGTVAGMPGVLRKALDTDYKTNLY